MSEFCALRAKTNSSKLDDDSERKKTKGTKKFIVKREITFKNYADALFKDKVLIKPQQRFKSDHHKVCTKEVNKIDLSSNDDKRIQTFDKVTTYPYGTNAFMVCENEMLLKNKFHANASDNSQNQSESELDNMLKEAEVLELESLKLKNELDNMLNETHVLELETLTLRNEQLNNKIDSIFA